MDTDKTDKSFAGFILCAFAANLYRFPPGDPAWASAAASRVHSKKPGPPYFIPSSACPNASAPWARHPPHAVRPLPALALLASMRSIHFDVQGFTRTYWDLFEAAGFSVGVFIYSLRYWPGS